MTRWLASWKKRSSFPVERNILKIHEELGKTGTLLIVKQNDPDFYLQHRWVGKFERT